MSGINKSKKWLSKISTIEQIRIKINRTFNDLDFKAKFKLIFICKH